MVYCLISGVILFLVAHFIQKRIRPRRKKKRIIWGLRVLRLASFVSALTIAPVLVFKHVGQRIIEARSDIYTTHGVSQSESYYARIDPAVFPKEVTRAAGNEEAVDTGGASQPEDTSDSEGTLDSDDIPGYGNTSDQKNTSGSGGTAVSKDASGSGGTTVSEGTSDPGDTSKTDDISQSEIDTTISYDFSVLMIWGEHTFKEYITQEDLLEMRSMYNQYWETGMYWEMLKQDNKTGAVSAQNGEDNIELLKQAAIAAENNAEHDTIETADEYASLFGYIRESVLKFSCVASSDSAQGFSIKEADIKYRMGKMLYKPAADLTDITNSEKYYSLCSAYIVLKDAFDHSSLDSTYAVDVAYYYLLVCNDIVDVMEPGQSQEMVNRVKLAYYQLLERVSETTEETKYQSYCEKAEQIMKRLEERN